jgi:competence ComEA-like helix-hairpin-helix protein
MRQAGIFRFLRQALVTLGALALWMCCSAGFLGAQKKPPAEPVDLNSASLDQLEQLPGIGPSTAKAIVQFREKSGPFERVEDMLAIHGISKKRLEKLRPYVVVRPQAQRSQMKTGAQSCGEMDFQAVRSQFLFCSALS